MMNKDKIKTALEKARTDCEDRWEDAVGRKKKYWEGRMDDIDQALRELEVADSPDMDGPYKEVMDVSGNHGIEGPGIETMFYKEMAIAFHVLHVANTAFKAGRSSLTGIDIEQEAEAWFARFTFDPVHDEGLIWTLAAFARFILSIKDGKGGGDVPKTEPALSAVSPAAQEDATAIAIAPTRKPEQP